MAPRGRDLTTPQKETIMKMSESGMSSRKIGESMQISANTVQKFLKRNRAINNDENTGRSGRKRFSTDRDDRVLARLVKSNRRQSLVDITAEYNQRAPKQLSTRTVRRRLYDLGYKRCVVTKKITIGEKNRKARVDWCRGKRRWTVETDWCKIIFSDEMKVVLGTDRKIYVWRKADEKFNRDCLGVEDARSPRAGISAMFWGCLSIDGVGTITEVDGNINSAKYISVLDTNLWPVITKNFLNKPWILQEDNCPVHRSAMTTDWKTQQSIETLTWPSQSPDINIIENVWRMIKIRLERRLEDISNRADLIRVVKEIWEDINSEDIISLYESIPKRIEAVIKSKGYITKY